MIEHVIEARTAPFEVGNAALERGVVVRIVLRRTVRHVAQVAVFVGLVSLFFFRVPQVEGRSMQPNIEGGTHVLINTLSYGISLGPWVVSSSSVKRGDIIAFERGQGDDRRIFLKRVIALPGETVGIANGTVMVNRVPMQEAYNPAPDRSNMKALIVPPGTVFVLGDNRAESDDSRSFGPVPKSAIIGKAVLVIWPLGHVGQIR